MTSKEMINYINESLSKSSADGKYGCLSEIGEKFIDERMKKSEDQGGFSNYWKEVSFEEAMTKRRIDDV